MKKPNVINVSCLLFALLCVFLAGCDKKDDDGGGTGSNKGWIRFGGQTYELARASADSKVQSFPGFSGYGYRIRVLNAVK